MPLTTGIRIRNCPHCFGKNNLGALVCEKCHKPLIPDKHRCPNCDTLIAPHENYCSNCGLVKEENSVRCECCGASNNNFALYCVKCNFRLDRK